jgi:hypothetical protein
MISQLAEAPPPYFLPASRVCGWKALPKRNKLGPFWGGLKTPHLHDTVRFIPFLYHVTLVPKDTQVQYVERGQKYG